MFKRLLAYFKTLPTQTSTQFFGISFPIWAACTYAFLSSTVFFQLQTYPFTTSRLIIGLGIYILVPSTLEEALYRPAFFPSRLKVNSWGFIVRMVISTTIFVVAHPITAYLFRPDDLLVFSD